MENRLAQIRDFNSGGATFELGGVFGDTATLKGLEAVFNNVVFSAIGLAGIFFFFMLVSAGFMFISAGGEPKKLEQARRSLTIAIVGMLIVILAYLVITIIRQFSGLSAPGLIDLGTFSIIGQP